MHAARTSPLPAFAGPLALAPLAADEVRVLRVALDLAAAAVERAAALLDDEESARAARFRLPDVARRFIVSHAALRAVLAAITDRPTHELRLSRSASGKPALAEASAGPDLRFNLSHTGELALIALCVGREVGVDAETLRPLPELERLAPRILGAAELATLQALPREARASALLGAWTRKEALLKAAGCGLRVPLPRLQVGLHPLPPDGAEAGDPLGGSRRLRLLDLGPIPGFACSLAWQESGPGAVHVVQVELPRPA